MPDNASTHYKPLSWPEGGKPPERTAVRSTFLALTVFGLIAGCVFRWMWFGLAIAGIVADIQFHIRNGQYAVRHIADQLELRTEFPAAAWATAERAAMAKIIAGVIAEEIAWPNPNFLPDDPLEMIFYCPGGDGAEAIVVFLNLEKMLGQRRHYSPALKTFAEYIDSNADCSVRRFAAAVIDAEGT